MSGYPFSVHMSRHTALLLIAAPLLVLAIPKNHIFQKALMNVSKFSIRLPFFNWIIGVGLMWVWHIPSLYNSMSMRGMAPGQEMIHGLAIAHIPVLHACSMIAGGMLFSWPIISPWPEYRLPPLRSVLYLSCACVFCSLLGLLITFAPRGTFSGITAADQQIGGLIMWVPCCFIYLFASMYLLIRWFSGKEEISYLKPINN
jgi:cytochrome c oxidase assembly factor CtaG